MYACMYTTCHFGSSQLCHLDKCRETCSRPKVLSYLDMCLQMLESGKPLAEGHADIIEQFYKKFKCTFGGLAINEERMSIKP